MTLARERGVRNKKRLINASGQIAGFYYDGSSSHGFLATRQ
jgi:hypothetical protein